MNQYPVRFNQHKNIAYFRFYEELNDFLHPRKQKRTLPYYYWGHPSVKHAVESIGVPHPEIDLILVNNTSVDFHYRLKDQDRVAVYPVFERLDISPIIKLRPKPLRKSTFILDVHLGKLARTLRLIGFDALYRNDYDDPEIVGIAAQEQRIILTRDRHLLQARIVDRGYWVRSGHVDEQLGEVLKRFDLFSQIAPFTRCQLCNGRIKAVTKEEVRHLLEPKTKLYYDAFFQCQDCGQVYWRGSHFNKLQAKIEKWRAMPNSNAF